MPGAALIRVLFLNEWVLSALLHSRIGIIFLKQMRVPPPGIPGRVETHTSQSARCVGHPAESVNEHCIERSRQ